MSRSFLDNVLLETAIDQRIADGVINLANEEHIAIFEEKLTESGMLSEADINSIIDGIIKEAGKYPDRQAFNKEGWLVTFPSAEYKRKAIEKGTHFENDPTHGKGGMNLYYKKKGKQARQRVQQTSVATVQQPVSNTANKTNPVQSVDTTTSTLPLSGKEQTSTGQSAPTGGTQVDVSPKQDVNEPSEDSAETPGDSSTNTQSTDTTVDKAPTNTGSPAPEEQPEQVPAPEPTISSELIISKYKESIQQKSMEFVISKGWIKNPTGDYYDKSGALVAIPSTVTGEIVPVNINQREELARIINKQ